MSGTICEGMFVNNLIDYF